MIKQKGLAIASPFFYPLEFIFSVMLKKIISFTLLLSFGIWSCSPKENNQLFELIPSGDSGITFENKLEYNEQLNAYTYRNFYNGAGVAIGDINNDGLEDIYLAGNLVDNKLYLNKGNLQFEDITAKAGVASAGVWSSGVSMADVNGDGLIDIYVCKSGPLEGENRYNELFINNGDLTFTERAKEFGVADIGLSNHAAFFDYDKDGDLDMYLLNNSTRSVGIYDLRQGQREVRDTLGGNKLYRNDIGKFTDVSEQAGIYGSAIGYGLGVTIADLNNDLWPDIFVSNDFFERDYLYINNQDGTFSERLEELVSETSMGSMGADITDLNNDGNPEIYVTEMLPEDPERIKTKTIFENWDKYQSNVKSGYHHQFTRNSLQWNRGALEGTDQPMFSEISRLSGIEATDWSWGALLFDYNNDGLEDIFVANGIYKDLTDLDYINFYANNTLLFDQYRKDSLVVTKLIDAIPSVPLQNYLYENKGNFNFENKAAAIGLDEAVFSNGAAYADLDNDGDLELVINNINSPLLLYKNLSREKTANNFIKVKFKAEQSHRYFGTKVTVIADGKRQTREFSPVKGYMSSMTHELHFGLGQVATIDAVEISWVDGTVSIVDQPQLNATLVIDKSELQIKDMPTESPAKPMFAQIELNQAIAHTENMYSDFDRDRLIFQMSSNEGPAVAVADVNGDGLEDLFVGGAKDFSGQLYFQQSNGDLRRATVEAFEEHELSEDVAANFADLNGDGNQDLIVASGGYEFAYNDRNLRDRIYWGDGKGGFELASYNEFNPAFESSSFILPIDFDGDGDLDLVSGTRSIPFAYGMKAGLHLYQNESGTFKKVRGDAVTAFQEVGMITDGVVFDIDNDGDNDLVVAGEWMPITVFENSDGIFTNRTEAYGLDQTNGLWHHLSVADFNGDGKLDLLAGNQGLNTRLKASADKPLKMYVNDYDQNRSLEQIITMYSGEQAYPIAMLMDITKQLPMLRKKYIKHELYKDQTIEDMFDPAILSKSVVSEVKELGHAVFIRTADGFEQKQLPWEAQISQVFASYIEDLDGDGNLDVLLAGNQTRMKPEMGINNASYGLTLMGNGRGTFTALSLQQAGLLVKNDTRSIQPIEIGGEKIYLFVRSNEEALAYRRNK